MKIFVKVHFFYKRLKVAIIVRRDLFDIIAIVIILDTLYNNFESTITSMFETGNKTIKEIQRKLNTKQSNQLAN